MRLLRYYGWSKKPDVKECAERAFRDLSRTLVYSETTNGLSNMDSSARREYEKCKKDFFNKVCGKIDKRVKEHLENLSQNYDDWHRVTCDEIRNFALEFPLEGTKQKLFGREINKKYMTFYHGQAQKWLNITFKNMWIIGLLEEKIQDENQLNEFLKELHTPVDDYILEVATTEDKSIKSRLDEPYIFEKGKNNSWSRWDYMNDYEPFQKHIKKAMQSRFITRLEWDNEAWSEIAEIRRNKKILE